MNKAKLKKTIKKDKKPKSILKTRKENQKQPTDDESINSEYLEELENQKPQISEHSDSEMDETEDNRRLRLAKQILKETKQELHGNDDFFQDVQMNDEDKKLNVALLEKFADKHTIYSSEINKFDREFKREIYKGHIRAITQTQVDSLGKVMYSCSKDSSIIKWDIETKKKEFLQREVPKQGDGHYDEILTMSLNFDGKILATAGKDHSIKLWDTNTLKLIDTLKHHKLPIYGVKFGYNSNNLCSVSSDRSFILWDVSQKSYIDTFYGHNSEANDIDCFNSDDFLTCGYDRQMIQWKTKSGGQLLYSGHLQSIDCIRALTIDTFASGSMDGDINLWNVKKRKSQFELQQPHGHRWITSLVRYSQNQGTPFNSDVLISGSYDDNLNIYKTTSKSITKVRSLQSVIIFNYFSKGQQIIQMYSIIKQWLLKVRNIDQEDGQHPLKLKTKLFYICDIYHVFVYYHRLFRINFIMKVYQL